MTRFGLWLDRQIYKVRKWQRKRNLIRFKKFKEFTGISESALERKIYGDNIL